MPPARDFPEFFSEDFTLILLFFLFFQVPVCLWHLFAGTVLCALMRNPLAGHSVLSTLSFLQFFLIFFLSKRANFQPSTPEWGRHCSFRAGLRRPDPQPCVLLQLVPSLRNPSDFTPEFFSDLTVYCFSPKDIFPATLLTIFLYQTTSRPFLTVSDRFPGAAATS